MTTEKGIKLDEGKNRLSLVLGGFSRACFEVGRVGTFGAKKYTDNGWQEVENGKSRYLDALLRHLFAYFKGELIDPESKLSHLAHVAWNALAILELDLKPLTHKGFFAILQSLLNKGKTK